MLSPETLEHYRRMPIPEKIKLVLRMMDEGWSALLQGSPEVVRRRFELLRRENDARNVNMLTAIARSREEE
jgi:hypothetical protein